MTRVVICQRQLHPITLVVQASSIPRALLKCLGLPLSGSRSPRFYSWKYSSPACWCRCMQPPTAIRKHWKWVVTGKTNPREPLRRSSPDCLGRVRSNTRATS